MKFYLLAILTICLASCGYRWQPAYPQENRPSISVPFVEGDEDGSFTQEIVRTLSTSGIADVCRSKGDYRLKVAIIGAQVDNIGYRLDRQKIKGKLKKNIVACEARKTMIVEATLFEGESERIAYGPYLIAEDSDYDYVDGDSVKDLSFIAPDGTFTTVLPFSLGQLEPSETAQEAATRPLYCRIAQKIVDALSSEW